MRWEDERYVRLYTRDTTDWMALSFDAQALLCLLLRKVDRAGLLPLGRHGKRGVAIAVGHPGEWARLEPALGELLADGCVRLTDDGGTLFFPNYIAAQEARSSDKSRQQKSREFARDIAAAQSVTSRDASSQIVTESHKPSHAVTGAHAESHRVTPSLAVPSRAEPSSGAAAPEPADEVVPPPAATGQVSLVAEPKPTGPQPEDLQALWNRLAPPKGLQRWTGMSDKRRRDARISLRDSPDLSKWEAWLKHEIARPFNLGDNPSGWKADVDWLLRAKTRDLVNDFDPAVAARTNSGGDRPRLPPRESPPESTQPAAPARRVIL